MATIALSRIHFIRSETGGPPPVAPLPEDSSQTFKAGELIKISLLGDGTTPGMAAEAGSNTRSFIAGFSGDDGHNDSTAGTHTIGVYYDGVFAGNVTNAGASTTIAQADVGKRYGLYRDTTNHQVYVDKGNTTTTLVAVIGLMDNAGDTNGRVYFKILTQRSQIGGTS